MSVSLLTLAGIFLLTALRQVGNLRFQIWQVMFAGAFVVLLAGEISVGAAVRAINAEVMLFLFGMFVLGQGLEESGYLAHLSYKYFKRARSRDTLLLMILIGAAGASALLMNDTLAIIGTPVVLLLARKHAMSPRLFLLALAFGVTIGSVLSPIGNPQNLLIALHGGLPNPFLTFLRFLFLPTIVSLGLAYLLLKRAYRNDFHEAELKHSQEPIRNHELAVLSRLGLNIVVLLVVVRICASVLAIPLALDLTHIAVAGALPILVGSAKRWHILRHLDWHTLVFFAAMFVVMESVWLSGFFQSLIQTSGVPLTSLEMILGVSILISQLISNVPLVALYLPVLQHAGAGASELMALAAGSTIAGNMFILGAASNVIVIQNAERKARETIPFWEFARLGVPLTLLNALVYWVFLRWV